MKQILILCIVIGFLSCKAFQYGTSLPKSSRFVEVESLGIAEAVFLKKYGNPTSRVIQANGVIEKLYYVEKLQTTIITTVFTFKNDILDNMEILNIKENFQPYMDSIRWEIDTHKSIK